MAETIAQAAEQIKRTVSLMSMDESATKQAVVLRLLSLAGWNTYDISEVVPEVRSWKPPCRFCPQARFRQCRVH